MHQYYTIHNIMININYINNDNNENDKNYINNYNVIN